MDEYNDIDEELRKYFMEMLHMERVKLYRRRYIRDGHIVCPFGEYDNTSVQDNDMDLIGFEYPI